MLHFTRLGAAGQDTIAIHPDRLIIAGWAGRDEAAIHHHIEELAAIGVPRPSSVPVYYRASAAILTQAPRVQVLGPDSSGEVEPVIVSLADGLWVTVGSDHTDRKAETVGIALSKQMCPKPVGTALWRLDDLLAHWDRIELASQATIGGETVTYQSGTLAALRTPADLIARLGGVLAPGTVMFGGTLGAIGGIRPASDFSMTLTDPVLGRSQSHAYAIEDLPVVS